VPLLIPVAGVALFAGGVGAGATPPASSRACERGVSGGTVASDRTPLPNRNARSKTTLVPRGASALLLCRYYGLNAGARSELLAGSATVSDAATIARLAAELDTLPRLRRGIYCPMDDESAIVAIFRYRNAPADPVQIHLKGCRLVSNGQVARTAISPTGARLIRQLEALVATTRRIAETRRCPAALAGANDLGTLAFIREQKLVALDVASCRERTLAPVGRIFGPVSWSGDGRFIAFGAHVVGAVGGRVWQPLSHSGGTLVWAPRGHELAGTTVKGGLLVGGPGMRARRLLPEGWGASTVAWSPSGDVLAVSRSLYGKAPPPYHQEIWLLNPRTGGKRELFQLPKSKLAPPLLYGFSPDGRWLVAWEDTQNSASLAADGLPLVAIRIADGKAVRIGETRGTLVYRDFLSWCDSALAYVVNRGGRQVTLNDRIAFAGPPPGWPVVVPADPGAGAQLSFVSPACSPPDLFELAAAVGPTTADTPFGHERRRIWLLGYTGGNWHPLGPTPPAGTSDELPIWSADGRWIAFIRSGPTNKDAGAHGVLYLLELGKGLHGRAKVVGPLADLGQTGNYYGHYGWSYQLGWQTAR
jgi:hypothetical protein